MLRIAGDRAAGIFVVEARHAGGALDVSPKTRCRSASVAVVRFRACCGPYVASAGRRLTIGRHAFQAMEPALTGEVLINGLDAGNTGAQLTRAAYSEENYRKLVALKDKYIRPTSSASTTTSRLRQAPRRRKPRHCTLATRDHNGWPMVSPLAALAERGQRFIAESDPVALLDMACRTIREETGRRWRSPRSSTTRRRVRRRS